MEKKIFILMLLIAASAANASPLIFSNDFETPPGTIEFIVGESIMFTQADESADFEVVVRDYQGNIVNSGDVQWSLSSTDNLSLSNPQSRTVSVTANSFIVGTVILTGYHPESNSSGQANVIMARVSSQTKILIDDDIISGTTPIDGNQNTIVLHRNSRTESIQVGDHVVSEQNSGLLVTVEGVTVNSSDVTIQASFASFTDAFETLHISGVSKKASYHAKIYGPDNTIEIRESNGRGLVYKRALFDLFSCKGSGGGSVGVDLSGASIDFDFDIEISPTLDIAFFTVNEMSLAANTETTFAFTTGSVVFDSSIVGEVDCQVESLPLFSSPAIRIYALRLSLEAMLSLGVKLQASIDGPSAILSGPSGIVNSQVQFGIKYTHLYGWEYLYSDDSGYQYDLIDGDFSDDVAFDFSAQPYAEATMSLGVSLGLPPLGIELGQLEFMEASVSETLSLSIATPLDPNQTGYMGPTANLAGRYTLTPMSGLSGPIFSKLNSVFGIDLNFHLDFDPLIDRTVPHWTSPTPSISAPTQTSIGSQVQIEVASSNMDDNGSFMVVSETAGFFDGVINGGSGIANWQVQNSDIGQHYLYPRISVDALSNRLPYASTTPQIINVGNALPPTLTFEANPTEVPFGGSTVLTWTINNNPETCFTQGGWNGNLEDNQITNGTHHLKVSNIRSGNVFQLVCWNEVGATPLLYVLIKVKD